MVVRNFTLSGYGSNSPLLDHNQILGLQWIRRMRIGAYIGCALIQARHRVRRSTDTSRLCGHKRSLHDIYRLYLFAHLTTPERQSSQLLLSLQ